MEANLLTSISNEEQHLLPFLHKKARLPPKELIQKQYSSDVKPIIKYITFDQLDKKNINVNYNPPKVKNQQFQIYFAQFHIYDYLGYVYADQLDQMIYFRYNNHQCNSLKDKQTQQITRFFAGMFIPYQLLASKTLKNQQSLFTALNISTPEIKESIVQSFAKNSKGCSMDPVFTSNFTGANLIAAIRKKPYEYDLIIQNDTNSKFAECFNFAVKFIEEGTYKFNIVNLSPYIPLFEMGMGIPCYSFYKQYFKTETTEPIKTGDGWEFGGQNISFLKSQIRKQTQSIDHAYYCLSFQYKCKNRQEVIVFANSFPYSSLDYEIFMNRIIFNKIGHQMKLEKLQFGSTISGKSLFGYIFYHRKSKSSTLLLKNLSGESFETHRSSVNLNSVSSLLPLNSNESLKTLSAKTIVFMARQHSGQSISSYFMEGIIEFIMDNGEFDKKNYQFLVVPFVNLDGVTYGNQRTNLAGIDLEKVWKSPNQLFEPQVYHLKRFLKKIHQSNPITLLMNISSNTYSLSSYFRSLPTKSNSSENPQLFPFMCSKRIQQISFNNCDFLAKDNTFKNSLSVLSQILPKALVYNFSCSVYGWKVSPGFRKSSQNEQNQGFINEFTPDVYRNMGKQIIATYMEYVKLCDKNIGIKERWQKQISTLSEDNKQKQSIFNDYQSQYEDNCEKQLIKFDYAQFMPVKEPVAKVEHQKRHKTLVFKPTNPGLVVLRSSSKKSTMPALRSLKQRNDQKQNEYYEMGKFEHLSKKSNVEQNVLQQYNKSTLASNLFSPLGRNNYLEQISKTIKKQAKKQQNEILSRSNSVQMTLKNQKQKRVSKILSKYPHNLKDKLSKIQGVTKFVNTPVIKQQEHEDHA